MTYRQQFDEKIHDGTTHPGVEWVMLVLAQTVADLFDIQREMLKGCGAPSEMQERLDRSFASALERLQKR
jgi:hypothetical protein